MDIEVQGAKQVKEKLPEAISIFIAPPSLEELERRLRGRSTESEEKILGRLETARHELELSVNYDHKVINDEVSRAANEILSIMRSHD
jgi:guanylate kinase